MFNDKINKMANLRSDIEKVKDRLENRIAFLENSIKECKESEHFEEAMKCRIKKQSFKLVLEDLIDALK